VVALRGRVAGQGSEEKYGLLTKSEGKGAEGDAETYAQEGRPKTKEGANDGGPNFR